MENNRFVKKKITWNINSIHQVHIRCIATTTEVQVVTIWGVHLNGRHESMTIPEALSFKSILIGHYITLMWLNEKQYQKNKNKKKPSL